MMVSVCLWLDMSLYHVFILIISQHIEIISVHHISGIKKTWHFNPRWFLGDMFCVFIATVPVNWVWVLFQPVYLPPSDSGFGTEFLKQVKELELHGVSAAEAGDLKGALQLFSQAIQIMPQRASAYNNRAQALRLQGDTAGTVPATNSIRNLSRQHSVPPY